MRYASHVRHSFEESGTGPEAPSAAGSGPGFAPRDRRIAAGTRAAEPVAIAGLRDARPHQLRARRFQRAAPVSGAVLSGLIWVSLTLPAITYAAEPFDAPLKVRTLRLPPDPQNSRSKRQVSCYYYRSIVIKQVDLGEVGADRLGLLPVLSRAATQCHAEQGPNEYDLPPETWSGQFRGVKADYAFFDAADGINGGLGFLVFRIYDRKALFEDVAERGLRSIEIAHGGLNLRYRRVFAGKCSVLSAGDACRDSLVRETGISAASLSICEDGYRAARLSLATSRCATHAGQRAGCIAGELAHLEEQRWDEAPTTIVYEVDTVLTNDSVAITPRSDALACHPSD